MSITKKVVLSKPSSKMRYRAILEIEESGIIHGLIDRDYITNSYPCPSCGERVKVRIVESTYYLSKCGYYEEWFRTKSKNRFFSHPDEKNCDNNGMRCPYCGEGLKIARENMYWVMELN